MVEFWDIRPQGTEIETFFGVHPDWKRHSVPFLCLFCVFLFRVCLFEILLCLCCHMIDFCNDISLRMAQSAHSAIQHWSTRHTVQPSLTNPKHGSALLTFSNVALTTCADDFVIHNAVRCSFSYFLPGWILFPVNPLTTCVTEVQPSAKQ